MISRVLLDTNVYTAFKRKERLVVETLRGVDQIALNPVVIAELLSGFRGGTRESENRDDLRRFLCTPRVLVVEIDEDTAEHYAGVYACLRRKGKPIPTNDMWIAATALQHGMGLFSLDDHFAWIDGLIVL